MRPNPSSLTSEGLRAWRKGRGWTQAKLARQLGCSLRAIQYYEAGERKIPLTIKRILDLLDQVSRRGTRHLA